jgi:8-amino-7-oxononanoate synthase
MNLLETLQQRLHERQTAGTLRKLPTATYNAPSNQPSTWADFASNDYLGFARNAGLPQDLRPDQQLNAVPHTRIGATGSRLLTGNTTAHQALEIELAQHFGYPAALCYNSGYDANVGLFSSLLTRHDTIVYDALVHASIRDGIRLSVAHHYSFRHNDLNDLESKLRLAKGNILVAIESIYSMDGDSPPLLELDSLCTQYGAQWVIDEAHAVGVVGPNGLGLAATIPGLQSHLATIITFSKAFGLTGAAVLGPQVVIDFLVNFSRAFIYTTALPACLIDIIRARLLIVAQMDNERQAIRQHMHYLFDALLTHFPNRMVGGGSNILSFITPSNQHARHLAHTLQAEQLLVYPILSPTVPAGMERLRICLHSYNTPSEIERLIHCLLTEETKR